MVDKPKRGETMLIFAQIETAVDETGGNPLIALAFIVGGLVVGSLLAGVTRRVMSADNRPAPIRSAAGAISTVVFSVILIVALITALGIVSPSSLDKLEDDLLDFIPRALAAAIVLIIANVVAQLVETAALGRSFMRLRCSGNECLPGQVRNSCVRRRHRSEPVGHRHDHHHHRRRVPLLQYRPQRCTSCRARWP